MKRLIVCLLLATTACAGINPAGFSADKSVKWQEVRTNRIAAQLPEGNYTVRITFKNAQAAANAAVKAEARRLMLLKQESADGKVRTFTVNVRRPEIAGGGSVKLNSRETEPSMVAHWDDLLSLEFFPDIDSVKSIDVKPAPDAVTVYIAGDSTVTDQRGEPWTGWGQCLPNFFDPGVAVANHAESGRALFSFLWEKRLDKILSTIKPGDYLFIQFGHNDQKDKREGAGPFTTYKAELDDYISKVRKKGAGPVLVTPMERRRWSGGKPQETLADYAAAMRQVAEEQKVPLIDLHAMSLKFYAALGEEDSKRAFVHYPANTFPGQDKALADDTHHNPYGGYELARCVVEGIKAQIPELAKHLRRDAGTFGPSHPDNPDSLNLPAGLSAEAEKPEGS
jgi:lysophospholipase L1-like esterase